MTRVEVPAVCARLRDLVEAGGARVVACDVAALRADVVAVEALARLQLTAWRLGCRLQVRRASADLQALLSLCGLADRLALEPLGQPEEGEQAGGVQERVDADDPSR